MSSSVRLSILRRHADRAADGTAEPDEAGAGKDVPEQVALDGVVVFEDEVEASPDDAADECDDDHFVGPISRLAELLEAPGEHRPGGDERDGERDPERLEGDRA